MAREYNNKWIPVVYDKGFIEMTTLVNNEWKIVKCDTKQEAERLEQEYKEFWKN